MSEWVTSSLIKQDFQIRRLPSAYMIQEAPSMLETYINDENN